MDNHQEENMLDLRRLIGILLTFYGLLITIYGAIRNPHSTAVSINLDLWWGILVLIVGLIFLLISLRKQRLFKEDNE